MKTGVFANPEKTANENSAKDFASFLESRGFFCRVLQSCDERSLQGVDVLFVLGGDGTILHCAEVCARANVKILGVNYGTLGFLAEFERDESEKIPDFLHRLERGEVCYVVRPLLQTQCDGHTFYSLNEAALRRDYTLKDSRMLKARLLVNGCDFDEFSGDGVLISTPTGSTAYSLSAGGPILSPQSQAMLLTPLCAFSLSFRPIVFSKNDCIAVTIERGDACLIVDGKTLLQVKEGQTVQTKISDLCAEFPTNSFSAFYKKLRKKLG